MVGPIKRERVEGRSGSIEGGCDGRATVLQPGSGWNTNHTSTDKSGETHVMPELGSDKHRVATCTGAMGGTKCKDGTWGNHHTPCNREGKTHGSFPIPRRRKFRGGLERIAHEGGGTPCSPVVRECRSQQNSTACRSRGKQDAESCK